VVKETESPHLSIEGQEQGIMVGRVPPALSDLIFLWGEFCIVDKYICILGELCVFIKTSAITMSVPELIICEKYQCFSVLFELISQSHIGMT
jgi:hypothetical protein